MATTLLTPTLVQMTVRGNRKETGADADTDREGGKEMHEEKKKNQGIVDRKGEAIFCSCFPVVKRRNAIQHKVHLGKLPINTA